MSRKSLRLAGAALPVAALLTGAGYLALTWYRTRNYFWGPVVAAFAAGYTEQQLAVRPDLRLNFAAGPASGRTPLLLIPGQGATWQDYAPVLPGLAEHFDVIAVDVHGHGKSTWNRADYNIRTIADDLLALAEIRFDRPIMVSGHSSGGLIAARMAAVNPTAVAKLVIEDAPFFATEEDRVADTFVGQDNALLAEYLQIPESDRPDWVTFSLPRSYIGTLFGDLWPRLSDRVLAQRAANPGTTPRIWWLGVSINRIWESISHPYDQWWSHAFFLSRSWHDGFDQAETLRQVTAPSLFIKASTNYRDGVLLAALSEQDAARVDELLPDNTRLDITAGHDVHFEKPEWFIATLGHFAQA